MEKNNKEDQDNEKNNEQDSHIEEDSRENDDREEEEDLQHSFKIRRRFIQVIGIILVISMILAQYRGPIQTREIAVKPVKNGIQIKERGVVESPYTINFEASSAMLSRDGSEAQTIVTGDVVEGAGLYYLTLFDEKGAITVETFEIELDSDYEWVVISQEDLIEAFKYAMENLQEKTTMIVKKELLQEKVIFETIEAVRDRYPNTVVPQGYNISYTEGEDRTTYLAQLFFDYGIEIDSIKKDYKQKIDSRLQYILTQAIEPDMTDLKKEYSILDYIIKTTDYSQEKVEGDYPPLTHTIYGAAINGIAVCDGYSKQLNYLLNAVGVPSRMIVGTSRDQGHQWNLVKIDGDYYHADVTWADSGSLMEMRYINQNDKSMRFTHQWKADKYPKCERTGSLLLPHFETRGSLLSRENLTKLIVFIPVGIVIAFVIYNLKRRKE